MTPGSAAILISVITVTGTLLSAWWAKRQPRTTVALEALETTVTTLAISLDAVRAELVSAHAEIADLKATVVQLTAVIVANNLPIPENVSGHIRRVGDRRVRYDTMPVRNLRRADPESE